MAISLDLKLCLSNFSRKTKRKLNGHIFRNAIYVPKSTPYFWPIFANFQNEADCLSVDSVTDRDPKWLFFMSWSNYRFSLSNPIQMFNIDAMVTFLWLIKLVILFYSTGRIIYRKSMIDASRLEFSDWDRLLTMITTVFYQTFKSHSSNKVCHATEDPNSSLSCKYETEGGEEVK